MYQLPVVKQVREVKMTNVRVLNPQTGIPTGEREDRSEEVVVRNDAEAFLSILSSVDFNKSERRKQRKSATKIMDKLQDWSIEHESNITSHDSMEVSDSELDILYDICIKDTPDGVQIQGLRMLKTLGAFEDWYDSEMKKGEESQSTEDE